MIGGSDKPQAVRAAVVFTRDASLAQQVREACTVAPACRTIHVTSGYEAAAELLAGLGGVLVIDLSCLSVPHRRLLEVGRRVHALMLGVGLLEGPFDAEACSGLQPIARNDLPAALGSLVAGEVSSPAAPAEPIETPPTEPARAAGQRPLAPPPQRARHEPPRESQPPPPVLHQDRLLTPEEIAALLENGT